MPIYKVGNVKKDGLQKYLVRINYVADNGEKKQLTRVAYGLDVAKDLERRLEHELKTNKTTIRKITIKQLYDEYIAVKKYEVRESTLVIVKRIFKNHIFSVLENAKIDNLSAKLLQDWKISIEEKSLGLNTKKNIFATLQAMLSYAVRLEYIPKNPLYKVRKFQRRTGYKKRNQFLYGGRI